ncbi:methyltransferase [bacterium]|nr:MAG: methyltransferase [bacterium]
MMNLLADLKRSDKVLDPFSGSGAITEVTYKYFKVEYITSIDIKQGTEQDFFKLDENQKFDKIITDPPWGNEQKLDNVSKFYNDLFNKTKKMLNNQGELILLTSFKVNNMPDEFAKLKEYNLSVSGKKAKLYKFKLK